MKRRILTLTSLLLIFFLFSGCAESIDIDDCLTSDPYGFFGGLWHGIIAPFSFISSIFLDDVAMYSVDNTGGWYDFGFVIGAGILFGGGGKASK
jgi:hypothetical protein